MPPRANLEIEPEPEIEIELELEIEPDPEIDPGRSGSDPQRLDVQRQHLTPEGLTPGSWLVWRGALEERFQPGVRPLDRGTCGAPAERRSTRLEVAFKGIKTRIRKQSSVRLLASPLRGPRCLRAFVVRVRFDARRSPSPHRAGAHSVRDSFG